MKTFQIRSVQIGADAEYQSGAQSLLHKWTDITLRLPYEFDWERSSPELLRKLRAAAELNEE